MKAISFDMRYLIYFIIIMFANKCVAQTRVDFRSFIPNSSLRSVNESVIEDLLDTTANRFLSLANDNRSALHKAIKEEFDEAKMEDRLKSYTYPSRLKKRDLNIQFVDWTEVHGLTSGDSVWNNTMFTSLIFIPVMIEEMKGESVLTICFKVEFEISGEGPLDGTNKEGKKFSVKKLDMDAVNGKEIN